MQPSSAQSKVNQESIMKEVTYIPFKAQKGQSKKISLAFSQMEQN